MNRHLIQQHRGLLVQRGDPEASVEHVVDAPGAFGDGVRAAPAQAALELELHQRQMAIVVGEEGDHPDKLLGAHVGEAAAEIGRGHGPGAGTILGGPQLHAQALPGADGVALDLLEGLR